jgi:hypothetical protein
MLSVIIVLRLEANMANEHPRTTAAQQQPRGVHLVGSVPLGSAEEVFRTASSILGERLRRIPDGETGERTYWIAWQLPFLASHPQFEMVQPDPTAPAPRPRVKLRSPLTSREITFDQLGYAEAALSSYAVFSRLKQAGLIPAHWRFQVSLPTPLAPITVFVIPEHQAVVEPAYKAALFAELDRISDTIPLDELAIQWDVAIEFALWEGVSPLYFANVVTEAPADFKADILERLVELGHRVPAQVELGYHLCYGDAGHRHFKEPENTTNLVEVANALSASIQREINWIHMPVPRDRSDDAYFEPLSNLQLHPETELYLGLVHFTDGAEGTRRRIASAQRVVSNFGVATECGLGRRPAATIPDLLRIHSDVAAPISA